MLDASLETSVAFRSTSGPKLAANLFEFKLDMATFWGSNSIKQNSTRRFNSAWRAIRRKGWFLGYGTITHTRTGTQREEEGSKRDDFSYDRGLILRLDELY